MLPLNKPIETGMLYLVPTPVGNLEDITLRAIRILKEVDLILAEDTRNSSILLRHFQIETPLQSFHAHNEHLMLPKVLKLLEQGKNVAQISDAGTPAISDPGFLLSRACAEGGYPFTVLPGASAILPALVMSGFPCDRFYFEGFLPLKKGRQTRILELAKLNRTVAFYESPHRLSKTLAAFSEAFGSQRKAAVIREISKLHETIHRGTLSELYFYFEQHAPKGEIVIVIHGNEE